MSDDDKDIKFRDYIAVQIMNMLLNPVQNKVSADRIDHLFEKFKFSFGKSKSDTEEEINNIARFSYKVADAMRKARLASFE